MGRAFKHVILGGGTAAGYAAHEFVKHGVVRGELCIISEEKVAPYERPALSKGYLMPDGGVRLPSFHTCVGIGEDRQTAKWYEEKGIELVLGTRVVKADVKLRTLTTAAGETISYQTLIVATGSRVLRLEEFGVTGTDCGRICYLRDIADADSVVAAMNECKGGRAVVIGGGYIGMEATAALIANGIKVSMVFPEPHCMARLFTKEMAQWYEDQYRARGVQFIQGSVIVGFEPKEQQRKPKKGKGAVPPSPVSAVILKDGTRVPTDMVVVGVGIRPNTDLFRGQLALHEPGGGGLRVNSHLCSVSTSTVYAIGDAAAFPLPLYGGMVRRMEHVDHARKSATIAVEAILAPPHCAPTYDYLPYFYSRVFNLSWQFFGDNSGECILYGNWDPKARGELQEKTGLGPTSATQKEKSAGSQGNKFGAYFVDKGRIVGAFLESGTKAEYAALAAVARQQPKVGDKQRLADLGTEFALRLVHGVGGTAEGSGSSDTRIVPAGALGAQTAAAVDAAPKGQGGAETLGRGSGSSAAAAVSPIKASASTPTEAAALPSMALQATAGIIVAVGIVAVAVWHGQYWRKRW